MFISPNKYYFLNSTLYVWSHQIPHTPNFQFTVQMQPHVLKVTSSYFPLHRLAPPLCPKKEEKNLTCDMFGGVNILSKFQLPSSYRLWFMILWRSGGKGSLTDWINEWINDEAVYRTAPATPGLLITLSTVFQTACQIIFFVNSCVINRPGVTGVVLQTAS